METLTQDLRQAWRSLRAHKATTLVAITCLALGIGATTAIFSVVRAVLMDSLPYGDPSRLVRLYETAQFGSGGRGLGAVSTPNFLDWQRQNRSFTGMSAYSPGTMDLTTGGEPETIGAIRATANLFAVLEAKPIVGRTFDVGADQPGRQSVVVIGYGLWQTRFGGDTRIVGKSISLDNQPFTVIGVMPPAFEFPITTTRYDAWVPLVPDTNERAHRGNHWMSVVARLAPGADSVSASADMSTIAKRLEQIDPDEMAKRGVQVISLTGVVVGRVRSPLLIMLGAVALVLLISCANVANLLLARATGRRREVAIRTALGAERVRLVRQFLTESVLLAIAGGGLGILVAKVGLAGILAYAAAALPRSGDVGISGGVLVFALAASLATGVAFGIVPALRASRADLRQDLTDTAGRAGTSRTQHRTLDVLVVAEVALSLVLVVGAGLLIRGFVQLVDTDPGLRVDHVLTFAVSAPPLPPGDSDRYTAFYEPMLARLRALPGVNAVATTTLLPIQNSGWNGNFTIIGRPNDPDPGKNPFAEYRVVSSQYFHSLGIPMLRGREFTDADTRASGPVVIVNEEFAKRYLSGQDPLARQLDPWTGKPTPIIGVARSVRQVSLATPPQPEVYVDAAQSQGNLGGATVILSTSADPETIVGSVRAVMKSIAPTQPLSLVESMDDVIADSLRGRKLTLSLLGVFAGLALLLCTAGVYGVLSYGVAQRTREIGIRMALGAREDNVVAMVLRDAGARIATGVLIGLAAAWLMTRVLASMLYNVGTHDPLTFVLAPLVIIVVGLVASAVPARRAARVDPLGAMRVD